MKRCPKCSKLLFTNTDSCARCGWKYVEDRISVGLCALSFLVSLFGLIYWIVAYDQTPRRATACGVAALLAPVIKTLLVLIFIIVFTVLRISLITST